MNISAIFVAAAHAPSPGSAHTRRGCGCKSGRNTKGKCKPILVPIQPEERFVEILLKIVAQIHIVALLRPGGRGVAVELHRIGREKSGV